MRTFNSDLETMSQCEPVRWQWVTARMNWIRNSALNL